MRPGQWQPERPYLNTASFGLPPKVAFDALQQALDEWRTGRTSWEHWAESTNRARAAFARLVSTHRASIAVGATVSELVGLVAATVKPRCRVLTAEGDFTSLIFPWAAQGHDVHEVALENLADAVDSRTDVVAVSVVQSASGRVTDLAAVSEAAKDFGALLVVDATQACGWLPVRATADRVLVCAGYKWLLAPRGTAYLVVGESLAMRITALHANWWAGEDPHASYYGLPLRLAREERRLDTSPAWFSWVGAAPALELLLDIGIEAINKHNVGLANRFRAGLGLEPSDSAIVSTSVPGAAEKLEAAGIAAATRAGSLRASFHVYSTEADVDAALDALS